MTGGEKGGMHQHDMDWLTEFALISCLGTSKLILTCHLPQTIRIWETNGPACFPQEGINSLCNQRECLSANLPASCFGASCLLQRCLHDWPGGAVWCRVATSASLGLVSLWGWSCSGRGSWTYLITASCCDGIQLSALRVRSVLSRIQAW